MLYRYKRQKLYIFHIPIHNTIVWSQNKLNRNKHSQEKYTSFLMASKRVSPRYCKCTQYTYYFAMIFKFVINKCK